MSLALAAGWFQANLQQAQGQTALAYLKQRGLSGATMEQFQLGYAPDSWDALLRHLGQVEGVTALQLEAAGLAIPRQGGEGHYDRFRQRLMIPIRNRQGRVVGFGGRSLDGREPKYLNSPETAVFEKGKILFGLDMAVNAIRKADLAVVVEGYFDVIALHSAGVANSVAALGTALSSWQITQLCRASASKRIVLNLTATVPARGPPSGPSRRWSSWPCRGNWNFGCSHSPMARILTTTSSSTAATPMANTSPQRPSGWIGRSSRSCGIVT